MWLKPQKAGGRFCPLTEANGNKTGTLFLKLMTLGSPLQTIHCGRKKIQK
jgi:hypothetical protein